MEEMGGWMEEERDGWIDGWVGGGMGRCEGTTSVNKSDLHREAASPIFTCTFPVLH